MPALDQLPSNDTSSVENRTIVVTTILVSFMFLVCLCLGNKMHGSWDVLDTSSRGKCWMLNDFKWLKSLVSSRYVLRAWQCKLLCVSVTLLRSVPLSSAVCFCASQTLELSQMPHNSEVMPVCKWLLQGLASLLYGHILHTSLRYSFCKLSPCGLRKGGTRKPVANRKCSSTGSKAIYTHALPKE